jgi:hypothetical protein
MDHATHTKLLSKKAYYERVIAEGNTHIGAFQFSPEQYEADKKFCLSQIKSIEKTLRLSFLR